LAKVLDQNFQDLDRCTRVQLLSMDGAIVLKPRGRIISVGAIVKLSAGSTEGARTAAAKALSNYGLGIKISQDGNIQGYRNEEISFDMMRTR